MKTGQAKKRGAVSLLGFELAVVDHEELWFTFTTSTSQLAYQSSRLQVYCVVLFVYRLNIISVFVLLVFFFFFKLISLLIIMMIIIATIKITFFFFVYFLV